MADSNEREDDYDAPPPGHTKGKWVPGQDKTQIMQTTIQTKGSVQYWCGPCNRRLGSRAIYEKHLMSSLHMRKVLPEHELEFSGHLEPMRSAKRPSRPSRFTNDSIYTQAQKKAEKQRKIKRKITTQIVKKKRKRNPIFVHCSGCKSRVRLNLMGKHLISHYHFRKATDIKSDAYRQLILNNISAIVHQSPFQCSPCKFYTNWLSNFMQHWFSEEHESKMASLDGRFWCSFCKFDCETSEEMLRHMTGLDHSEVVAVVNRSMPIIIRKKTIITCECGEEFRYNVEVKKHCKITGHKVPYTATDDYQEFHKCRLCNDKFKSSLGLAAHLKLKHKQKAYFCLVCSLTFKSFEEAKRHRFTSVHRIKRKEIRMSKGKPVKNLRKKCPYCTENVVLRNVLVLKEHIRTVHPEIKKRCPKCGMAFILFQEVSRHVRSNACQFQDINPPSDSSIMWNCSQCLFTTESKAECYYHEVLYTETIKEYRKVGDKEVLVEKYPCPVCSKTFRKRYLREHLRMHTSERPFVCSTCGANYTTQSSLSNHTRIYHQSGPSVPPPKKVVVPVVATWKDDWKCNRCSKTFSNRSALSRHACDGVRRCPHDGCEYTASTPAQLARHRIVHGENIKNYECTMCSFKTNHTSNMERHLRCHKGAKPYRCPHCEYAGSSLENLRKHVLKSGRHPGKFLYQCPSCVYQSNTATDLRAHLTSTHSDRYDAKSAVQAVKLILMKEDS